MESKHSELLACYRNKLVETVDVEKLLSRCKLVEIFTSQDVDEIRNQANSNSKVETFFDILATKGSSAFATLCRALESTYPHLLTVMFLGSHKLSESKLELDRSEGANYSSSSTKSNQSNLKADFKSVAQERDALQKQLQKVLADRDFLEKRLAMSNSDPLTRLGSLTKQHASSSSDKSLSGGRDYDWLKCQCEQAMSEVQALRRQHTDTARRCDTAVRESEFYRAKHRQAVNKIDKQQHELQTLRQQFKETLTDKRRLEEDVMALQAKDMSDGGDRHRQKSIKNENARTEAINQMYNALVNKYDELQVEYDSLHKRFSEVLAVRSATASAQMEMNEDEIAELRKRYEDVLDERNNLTRERNGLSQQCTAAIHKWDTTLRELNSVKESLAKVQQQRDEAMKEINQAMAGRIKAAKDLARLTEERNAAVQEYSLVMLERDSVHKEIEKLQEELSEANRRADSTVKEKKLTLEELETLRREISSALHDRDRALKECNDLREKYGDYVTGRQENGERREFDNYSRRDSSRKSRSESFGRQDALVVGSGDSPTKYKTDKTVDNLEQANLEIDRLRKNVEKLQDELTDAQQEAEVCKRRRDWAFNERDKIVLERESIRTLCDKLRRERDRAVSDLAEALRDSDDIKKQRNEAAKELKELREKVEVQMEKESSRTKQLNTISHNHSHDSAIDTDLQEWEMETISIDLGNGINEDLIGFELSGGKDDPQFPDSGIFVSAVTKGSVADGKLKIHDTILQINNVDLTNCNKNKAWEAIRSGCGFVSLLVRRRHSTRHIQSVQLQLGEGKEHGLTLESGLYVSRIMVGSVAAKEGNLAVGDRIININGKNVDNSTSPTEAMQLLSSSREPFIIAVVKCNNNNNNFSNHGDSLDSDRSPTKDLIPRTTPIRDSVKKLSTSSSQTEDVIVSPKRISSGLQSKFLDRAYHKFFPERRRSSDKKTMSMTSSPSPVHEEEVIAHLDSVIDHFKKNKTRRRKEKNQDKSNGGTWPRCRATAPPVEYVEQCVGTVFNPLKRKERKSIAALMNNSNKISGGRSPTDDKTAFSTFSTFSPKLSSPKQSPFHPTPTSHYSTASSLDSPLDYSVVSANKDVLEYYHRNKVKIRPKSSHYPQSDSESLSAADSPVPQKPSSLDLPSLYPKHPSSGSMSSGVRSVQNSYLRSPPTYFPVSSGRILHAHPSHPHPHSPTTSSSLKYSSRSGESLGVDARHYHRIDGRCSLNPSSSSSPHSFSHSPSQSVELHHYHHGGGSGKHHFASKHSHREFREDLGGYGSYDGPSTFPKRVHQRTRLPSNQSVTSKSSGGKMSTSSIDKSTESTNVLPYVRVSPRVNAAATSMPDFRNKKLGNTEPRTVIIEKSAEPLGIQIACGPHGGIFVSSVSENSLAALAGVQIGDQLLEVCGINMRSATYLLAANVLRQCGDSITMLVQYCPDKYKEALETTASSSSSSSTSSRSSAGSVPTPTPSSSPKTPKNEVIGSDEIISPSASSTLTRPTKSSGQSSTEDHVNGGAHDPRRVFLKKCSSNFGVSLLGGNAVGIFVHAVHDKSPASGPNGLRSGDQILEYNGIDLRSATAEQAASELAKPGEMVSILAQYNYSRYLEVQDQPGDSFYIRTMFDRSAESPDELSFRKDDILFVDNTMLNGISGMWRAWLVNEDGQKRKWGIIPSKYKVDEELLLKRSLGDLDSDSGSRRGNTSARRSFFRRKKHQRSNSRDSKELASYSDVSINSYGETSMSLDETIIPSYLRVERLDYLVLRPVLILGPLIESVVDKLVQDFPHKFQRCIPEPIRGSPQTVERGIQDNKFVDYRRRGSHFECITVAAVKEICDTNTHCIIDVSPQSVERLHLQQIYPIVLFIKFKSTKQIREVKDSTFLTEKVSTKAAKEMYEHSLKMENEYKHLISAVIPGGSLAYLCAQIKACVEQEQSKTLWVRATGTV